MDTKTYERTETGKAEIFAMTTCPICGAGGDGNTDTWDFVSNKWSKAPLLCGHGYVFTENCNPTDDAANDCWQDSVLIRPEYIQELEALGYSDITPSELGGYDD